jgi:hypothetical protein
MGYHPILRQVGHNLVVLQQDSGLLQHLTAESLGKVLALRIDLGLEAVSLGKVGLAKRLRKQPIPIQQAIMLL